MSSTVSTSFEVALAFISGIKDMILGCLFGVKILWHNSKIRNKVTLSFLLNGIILALSILLFEHVVLRIIVYLIQFTAGILSRDVSLEQLQWMESIISYTFTFLWTLPMFVICTPINSIWFREIALEASDFVRKSEHSTRKLPKWSLKVMITDILYGISVEIIFSIQATIANVLPIGGPLLAIAHLALLYSLYSFEYKWFYQGITVQKRLLYIEQKWPYFLGFGLTLSILTSTPFLSPFAGGGIALHHTIGDVILSACTFALAFPLLILASFRTPCTQYSFYRVPVFKLSRLTCNRLFNLLLIFQ